MKRSTVVAALLFTLASAATAAIPYERPLRAPAYGFAADYAAVASAASDGDSFLVVWDAWGRDAIYAARLTSAGALLDPTGIRVAAHTPKNSSTDAGRPAVVHAGDAYVLFWSDAGIWSARLDNNGNFLDDPHRELAGVQFSSVATNGARIVAAYDGGRLAVFDLTGHLLERDIAMPGATQPIALSSNGSGFLATWASSEHIANALDLALLDASGHVAGAPRAIPIKLAPPYVQASNGSDYLVVYATPFDNARQTLRISAAGDVLGSQPLPAYDPLGNDMLTWTGAEYLLTWQMNPEGLVGLRLDAAGTLRIAAPVLLGPALPHATAAAGGQLLVTFGGGEVSAELVALPSLTPGTPRTVSASATPERRPWIAFSGRNYLVVWNEYPFMVYASRLDLDGRVLDPGGIKVADFGESPKIVFDGKSFVVAWSGSGATKLNAIDPDSGALLTRDGVDAGANYSGANAIATDGNSTMLVYHEGAGGTLMAVRYDHALQRLGGPVAITQFVDRADNPAVAWSGTQWVVVFNEFVQSGGINLGVVRLSPSLTPIDMRYVASGAYVPAVASSGDDVLIAWTGGPAYDVFAAHMLPDGTIGPAIPLGSSSSYVSSAIWTGTSYAVGFPSDAEDAVGVLVGKFGVRTPGAAFKISATPDRERGPVLVAANGRITGVYERQAGEVLYGGAWRVFIRDARPLHGRPSR